MGFSRQEYWSGLPLPSPAAALRATMFPLPSSRFLVLGVHCSQIAPVPISLALGGSLASPLWLETVVLLLGCLRPWAQTASFPGVSPKPLIFVDAASQLFSAGPHCSPRSKAGGCSSHLSSSLPLRAVSLSLPLLRASLPLREAGRQTLTQRGKVTSLRSHS